MFNRQHREPRTDKRHHCPVAPQPEPYTLDETMYQLTRKRLSNWNMSHLAGLFQEHEAKGKHPTYHTAKECNVYKALVREARRLRNELNRLDLDSVDC